MSRTLQFVALRGLHQDVLQRLQDRLLAEALGGTRQDIPLLEPPRTGSRRVPHHHGLSDLASHQGLRVLVLGLVDCSYDHTSGQLARRCDRLRHLLPDAAPGPTSGTTVLLSTVEKRHHTRSLGVLVEDHPLEVGAREPQEVAILRPLVTPSPWLSRNPICRQRALVEVSKERVDGCLGQILQPVLLGIAMPVVHFVRALWKEACALDQQQLCVGACVQAHAKRLPQLASRLRPINEREADFACKAFSMFPDHARELDLRLNLRVASEICENKRHAGSITQATHVLGIWGNMLPAVHHPHVDGRESICQQPLLHPALLPHPALLRGEDQLDIVHGGHIDLRPQVSERPPANDGEGLVANFAPEGCRDHGHGEMHQGKIGVRTLLIGLRGDPSEELVVLRIGIDVRDAENPSRLQVLL
mmetsp:Transcript_46803/g.150398  ORF Transcript_46803/g.150398 Transcript_46803/m.150398 type:complete len:417 (-) Transcript_46803:235-1485(-)